MYRRLYLPLCMYALRLTDDADESRDIVHESFSRVWAVVNNSRDIANFKAYMYRTVHNVALERMRSRNAVIPVDCVADIIDEVIDTSERDAALWRAIDALPDRCREVFLLSKRDGLSNGDIAEELGISVKTVENQITKAFSRLRSALDRSGGKAFFLPFL